MLLRDLGPHDADIFHVRAVEPDAADARRRFDRPQRAVQDTADTERLRLGDAAWSQIAGVFRVGDEDPSLISVH